MIKEREKPKKKKKGIVNCKTTYCQFICFMQVSNFKRVKAPSTSSELLDLTMLPKMGQVKITHIIALTSNCCKQHNKLYPFKQHALEREKKWMRPLGELFIKEKNYKIID